MNSFGNRDSDLDLCLSIRGGEDNSYSERDAVPILYMVYQILKVGHHFSLLLFLHIQLAG